MRVSLAARRSADFETGLGAAGLLRPRALLDQRQRDVGVRVFLVGADELPQIDFVGDGDLRLGAALLGRLLGLLLVVLLALVRAALDGRRRRDARAWRAARAGPSGRRGAGVPGPPAADRAGTRAAGRGAVDATGRAAGPTNPVARAAGARARGGRPPAGPAEPVAAGSRRRGAGRDAAGSTGRGGRMILRGSGLGASGSGSEATTAVRAGSAGLGALTPRPAWPARRERAPASRPAWLPRPRPGRRGRGSRLGFVLRRAASSERAACRRS